MLKRLLKVIFFLLIVLSLLVCLLVYFVKQPILKTTESPVTNLSADAERLTSLVRVLSEEIPRTTGDENLNAARDFIKTQLETTKADIRFQAYQAREKTFFNVIARIQGKEACALKVVGAHYDAFAGHPGADDNASGVAALLEVARILDQGESPPCPVELVAYANEEPPYFRSEEMGSFVHAKSLHAQQTPVSMMISLETMGYFSDEPGSQHFPLPFLKYLYSDVGNYICLVGDLRQTKNTKIIKQSMQAVMTTEVYSINAPSSISGIDFSDHLNYWHFGYPGVMLTDTAFNRNLAYHTPDDTWDRLDYTRMADVVNGVVHALLKN